MTLTGKSMFLAKQGESLNSDDIKQLLREGAIKKRTRIEIQYGDDGKVESTRYETNWYNLVTDADLDGGS